MELVWRRCNYYHSHRGLIWICCHWWKVWGRGLIVGEDAACCWEALIIYIVGPLDWGSDRIIDMMRITVCNCWDFGEGVCAVTITELPNRQKPDAREGIRWTLVTSGGKFGSFRFAWCVAWMLSWWWRRTLIPSLVGWMLVMGRAGSEGDSVVKKW